MMTDSTFDTLEALEAWVIQTHNDAHVYSNWGLHAKAHGLFDQIARVSAAHAHLLEGNDDVH